MTHPKDPNSTELFAEWDGDKNTAYRFPHPEINYHSLELAHVRAQMPGGKPVEDLIPTFERVRITDPKGFSPYDPVTWQPWIDTDDLFKPRELIRELREAPQLGVRFNPPPQRERLFKMLTEWVYAAVQYGGMAREAQPRRSPSHHRRASQPLLGCGGRCCRACATAVAP